MKCEYEKIIDDILEDKASKLKVKQLIEHSKTCTECFDRLEKIDKIDKLIMEELTSYPFESNKDKIIERIKKERKSYNLFAYAYRVRGYLASFAVILFLFFSLRYFVPYLQAFKSNYTEINFSQKSNHDKEAYGTFYIRTNKLDNENTDINKLYPSYIPSSMKLSRRTKIGSSVTMQFNGTNDRRGISISITSIRPSGWVEEIDGKDIKNTNGEWLLKIEEAPGPNKKKESVGELRYQLNAKIYVRVNTYDLPKEEIIKMVNSLEETNKELKNDLNDQTVIELLGPKLKGSKPVTIKQAIDIVNSLSLQYIIKDASADEYDKKLSTFSVKNLVVTLTAEK